MMQSKFSNYISNNHLFTKKDKLLVAVSGGADSMALLCLLWTEGYNFGVAHCNFQLRGEESDGDERFVELFASYITPHFHKKRFDTEGSASDKKTGIQETARDLRYAWFEELRQTFDYQYILTAHHASDSIETVVFNLIRGTGLRGLTGIKPKNGYLIRPLLFAAKTDILAYVKQYKIPFREDSSNESDKYARNLIRHLIIPELKKINPEFENTLQNTIKNLNETQDLMDYFLDKMRSELIKINKNQTLIPINKLKELPSNKTVLLELIKDFGFNAQQVESIISNNKIGNKFYSKTHELLIDRSDFIIQLIDYQENTQNFSLTTQNAQLETQNTEGSVLYVFEDTKTINFNNLLIKNELTELNKNQLITDELTTLNSDKLAVNPLIKNELIGTQLTQLNSNELIINKSTELNNYQLNSDELIANKSIVLNNYQLIIDKSIELNPIININKNIAQLNYDQLIFPLKLRHWQVGDRFQPLGMNGKSQLVSDYFQQQKLSEFDKKKVLILENGDGRICWIVGFRLAEPFKLLAMTKEIFKITLVNT